MSMVNQNYIAKNNIHKVKVMLDIVKDYSYETYTHMLDVASKSLAVGKKLRIPYDDLRLLYTAGLLHDVGKLAVNKDILHKPECSPEDVEYIRSMHIKATRDILDSYFDEDITTLCSQHHERLDGSGYPYGLRAEHLGVLDRILAVADTVSAMTLRRSHREYSKSDEKVESKLHLLVEQGKLDADIVEVMITHLREQNRKSEFSAYGYETSLKILRRASLIDPVEQDMPTMYVFAGPNASGKSTLIANKYIQGSLNVPYINADIITKFELSDIEDEEERNKQGMFTAMQRVEDAIENRTSFVYETVLSHPSKLELIERAKEKGFQIASTFVYTDSPSINLERLAIRVQEGGHDVPREKLESRYERSMQLSGELVQLSDTFERVNNSEEKPIINLQNQDPAQ